MKKRNRALGVFILGLLVTYAYGCAPPRQEPGGAQATAARVIDDTVITSRVRGELLGEQALSSFRINVETFRGEVLLSGFVDSQEQAQRAVEVAKQAEGVERVINAIVVRDGAAKGKPGAGETESPAK